MPRRNKYRFHQSITVAKPESAGGYGFMCGTAKELGDIVGPVYDGGPCDCELGIAYHGENGKPVYYTGNGTETTDDLK